jgi:Na+/H+-dicarboxylate symporter
MGHHNKKKIICYVIHIHSFFIFLLMLQIFEWDGFQQLKEYLKFVVAAKLS